MLKYAFSRFVALFPILLLLSVIVFLIMYLLPGDPAAIILAGQQALAGPEQVAKLREQLGLNDPVYIQYGRFLLGAVQGDLGISARFGRPVIQVILEQFPSTLWLAFAGMTIALILGLGLGILAAITRGSWLDTLSMTIALIGVSTPIFWSGLMAIFFFSFRLQWLPATSSASDVRGIILPAFTLGFVGAGTIARLTRSGLIETLSQDYIRTARAKGLRESMVILRHGLKNALIPIVTIAGLQFGTMLAGAVVTETVFSRPGIGRLVVSAIEWKDFRLAQGAILLIAVAFVLVNLAVDISYAYLDPRIRRPT